MAKKLISCLVVLTLVLGMVAAFNVSAADYKLTIIANDATTTPGQDVTVKIGITSSDVSYYAFNLEWDTTKLTYKSYNLVLTGDTAVRPFANDGYIEFQTLRDANVGTTFNNTTVIEFTFTATSDIGAATSITTPINVVIWPNEDEAYVDGSYNGIDAAYVRDVDGTVTIQKPHEAPVVDAAINGSGKVGEALTASAQVTDNWNLQPTVTYTWKVGGTTVSTTNTYTPVAADLGKTVTVEVKATVDATSNPTTTVTKTKTIVKNDAYKPAIGDVEAPESVMSDEDIVITYDYEDGNGIADASYAVVTATEDGQTYTNVGTVNAANGKITVPVDGLKGKNVKVVIVPKNADGVEGTAVTLNNIPVNAYVPEIDNVKVSPSNVKAGNDIVITYDFEDGNGLEDDSYAVAWLLGDEQEQERLGEFPVQNGKITIPTNKDMANKKIGVVIVPRNEDGDQGREVALDPISVAKKSSGSKTTGGGASLVPKDEKEDEKECIIMTIDDVNIWRWDEWVKNDVPPIIVNDRTFLPSRFVAEALGAKVDWDDATKTVTIVKGNISIILVIGSDIAVINGEEVKFDAPAFIQDDRTYTPTRLVAEALGATVDWDDATRKVTITR